MFWNCQEKFSYHATSRNIVKERNIPGGALARKKEDYQKWI